MKRFLLIVSLLVASVSASAMGFRSLDLKANLRSDFGVGVGMSFNLPANFKFAPSFNYYFDSGNAFTIDADFRYRFDLPKSFSIYPLAGPLYFHCKDHNNIGLNVGAGFSYDINDAWSVGAEAKYQYVNHFDDFYLSLGVSYLF